MSSRAFRVAVAALTLLLPPLSAQTVGQDDPIRGFSRSAARAQLRIEAGMAAVLDRDSTGRHFRYLTAEPHVAGSLRNKELADYMVDRFREYGLEDVRLHRYDVLLPYPETVSVTMLEPYLFEASLREDAHPEDPDSYNPDVGLTYLGMSASGDVTGELVYASSGNPEDYDWLEAQGIELEGKIAIVRYSVPYSYRGFKALTAEERGLAAIIIYSDPADDGYRKGITYPDGPWGGESHIQRGSITYDFIVPGDPLTPGWASVDGAERIPVEEARSVPSIIAVPMSYRDATPLLQSLGGPVAPQGWQGALPFTYRVGAGPAKVRVHVRMDGGTRSIWVVEGRIRGSEEPEKTVVLGNHRDAWVFGGVDPSSGTATQLEMARALGAMLKEGHRPRRSVVLTSWDAEEWHLTGSTEWGEQFAEDLGRNAMVYLNVDSSTAGSELLAGAVASLNPLVVETLRDVRDPASGGSVLEAWGDDLKSAARQSVIGGNAETTGAGDLDPLNYVSNRLGSGSDYTVFLNFLGVPIVGMAFDGPYGVYHSQYDSYEWMTRFGDPGFRYMTTMGEIWARMALRMANAQVLPYDFGLYARRVGEFLDDLEASPGVADRLDLSEARDAQRAWSAAARDLEDGVERALAAAEARPVRGDSTVDPYAELNRRLLRVEREFLLADGIPGRPWFRHVLYAPKYTYDAMMLPGVQEAVDRGDWTAAQSQVGVLAERLAAVASAVRLAREAVPAVGGRP